MPEFANKVAIVTGSSSGIGAAVALALAREGALLTIHGRNADALAEVGAKIKEISGRDACHVIGDMLDESTAKKILDATLEKFGQVDILVNNAGMSEMMDSVDAPDFMDTYDRLMGVNVRSVVQLTHITVPHLAKTKGNIVNISSIAAHIPFTSIYSMTKAALDMFTKSMANQCAPKSIRVNSVNPGPVRTNFVRDYGDLKKQWENEDVVKSIANVLPARHFPDGDDIAHSVLFLANDRTARNMTGTILVNDSGTSIDQKSLTKMLDP